MRVVPTSGGLEWDSDGSCYLDAIPGPPGRRAKPLALDEVIAAVRGGHDRDPAPVIAKARGLQTLSALL